MNNKEFIIGKLSETEFSKLFTNVTPSTKEQDIYEHWDLKLTTNIDVKAIKKENRGDVVYNENFHWIELKNVRGKLGWLYGEADFFAFETNDYWVLVEKLKLQDFIKTKMVGKEVGKIKDPYELYQRDGQKDVIVKVKTIDLIYIAVKMLNKNG
jgi:hypothetical protein